MIRPLVQVRGNRLEVETVSDLHFDLDMRRHFTDARLVSSTSGHTSTWSLPLQGYATVMRLLEERWDDTTVDLTGGVLMDLEPLIRRTPHQVLHVTTDAPVEVITAAYKALVRIYHEGSGSGRADPEIMLAINVAYQAIKGDR